MQQRSELKDGVYVRVVGSMRVHNDKKGMIAFNIRKVSDFNELTYHLLDICQAHLYNTRGPPPSGAGGKPAAGNSSSTFFSPGRPNAPGGNSNNSNSNNGGGGGGGMQVESGLALNEAVMKV